MSDEQFRCENKIVDLMENIKKLNEIVSNLQSERGYFRQSEQQTNKNTEILREYFEYRKIWSEEIMKRFETRMFKPIDTWAMISLHKISKELLEKLEGKVRHKDCCNCGFNKLNIKEPCNECHDFNKWKPETEKKEYIASLNDPKAFEAINLGVLKRSRKDSEGLL